VAKEIGEEEKAGSDSTKKAVSKRFQPQLRRAQDSFRFGGAATTSLNFAGVVGRSYYIVGFGEVIISLSSEIIFAALAAIPVAGTAAMAANMIGR